MLKNKCPNPRFVAISYKNPTIRPIFPNKR